MTMSDADARRVASEWHGGQSSPLYAFTSTGATTSRFRGVDRDCGYLLSELAECRACASLTASPADLDEVDDLIAYVVTVGDRGPQEGWSR